MRSSSTRTSSDLGSCSIVMSIVMFMGDSMGHFAGPGKSQNTLRGNRKLLLDAGLGQAWLDRHMGPPNSRGGAGRPGRRAAAGLASRARDLISLRGVGAGAPASWLRCDEDGL